MPQGELPAAGTVLMIPLDEIETNPFQPRNDFDETALQELADSIRLQGIIQPVTVRKAGDRLYQLISGERRLRASRMAGLQEIPDYIRLADDRGMLELALIENRSEEHTSELQSLMRISYAVFCLKKKKRQ